MHPSLQLWLGSIVPFTVGLVAWQVAGHAVSLLNRKRPGDSGGKRWERSVLPAIAYNAAMHIAAIVLAAWIDAAYPGSFVPFKYAEGVVVMGAIVVAVEMKQRSNFPLFGTPPLPRGATGALSALFLTPWMYIVRPDTAGGLDAGRLYLTAIALTFAGLSVWQYLRRGTVQPAARSGSRHDRR